MESSKHSLLSFSWIAHVWLWITTALSHKLLLNEWLMLDYGIITTLSREFLLNEWLMHLKMLWWFHCATMAIQFELTRKCCNYGIPQNYHMNSSWINDPCWTTESSQHSHVNSSCTMESSVHSYVNSFWISHFAIWNHQSILTWSIWGGVYVRLLRWIHSPTWAIHSGGIHVTMLWLFRSPTWVIHSGGVYVIMLL
jgi:hypothetical protein